MRPAVHLLIGSMRCRRVSSSSRTRSARPRRYGQLRDGAPPAGSPSSRGPWEQSQAWAWRRSARCASKRRIAPSFRSRAWVTSSGAAHAADPETVEAGRRRSGSDRRRAASRASRTARSLPRGPGRRASGRRGRAVHRRLRRREHGAVLHRSHEHHNQTPSAAPRRGVRRPHPRRRVVSGAAATPADVHLAGPERPPRSRGRRGDRAGPAGAHGQRPARRASGRWSSRRHTLATVSASDPAQQQGRRPASDRAPSSRPPHPAPTARPAAPVRR